MTPKFKRTIISLFAAAVAAVTLSACKSDAEYAAEKQETLETLEKADATLLGTAGFNIKMVTGRGEVRNGEISRSFYFGASTDICYLLTKAEDKDTIFKACVTHNRGESAIVGLQAVTPFTPKQ